MVQQKRATRCPNREPKLAIAATIPSKTPSPAFNLSQLDPILRANSVASTQQFSPFSNHESIIDTQYPPLSPSPIYDTIPIATVPATTHSKLLKVQ
jgi:hypothetical protein